MGARKELKLTDFARLFGTDSKDISKDVKDLIAKGNFAYRKVESDDRDKNILAVLKKIESGELQIAGKKVYWQKTWGGILKNFIGSNYSLKKLIPRYFKRIQFLRFYRNYIKPEKKTFSEKWFNVFKLWLFEKYLKDVDNIYEFGCGTGQNLILLANIFPDKKLFGFDWVKQSASILNLAAKKYGYKIKGGMFNFFSPDEKLRLFRNSAVLTVHALEQIGSDFEPFLKFILKKSPILCINVEPICELYDEEDLFDYLAIKFHKSRNYLNGYLSRLLQLERDGKVEILKIQRVFLGSFFHDSHSYIIWRPKNKN